MAAAQVHDHDGGANTRSQRTRRDTRRYTTTTAAQMHNLSLFYAELADKTKNFPQKFKVTSVRWDQNGMNLDMSNFHFRLWT